MFYFSVKQPLCLKELDSCFIQDISKMINSYLYESRMCPLIDLECDWTDMVARETSVESFSDWFHKSGKGSVSLFHRSDLCYIFRVLEKQVYLDLAWGDSETSLGRLGKGCFTRILKKNQFYNPRSLFTTSCWSSEKEERIDFLLSDFLTT